MLCQLRYIRYCRHFRTPVKTSRGSTKTREGIFVSLESTGKPRVTTEIAPWDGFSCESLDNAERLLKKLASTPLSIGQLPEIIENIHAFPCTRHALSAASFFFEKPGLLDTPEPQNKHICKLILRDSDKLPETVFEQIQHSRNNGFRTFKIKIGLNPIDDEIRFCEKILCFAENNFPKIQIRFDANGAWNDKAALEILKPLNRFLQLEFIEQPLAATSENDDVIYNLPPERAAKIALDESLREPWKMPSDTNVVAVIKPLLIGDFFRLRKWLTSGNTPHFVISSVFETECGRKVLSELCDFVKSSSRALAFGIDTRNVFTHL